MKTSKGITILAVTGIAFLFASCSETISGVDETIAVTETVKSTESVTDPGDNCTFLEELTEADIVGLLEMREEEKLARDVYRKLFEIHGHIIFDNISKSENAHSSAVLYLINGYGLEDPALAAEGEFSNPLFTDLYQQLTEQGSASLIDALKVGAFIEEYDINDLWNLIDETNNSDIQRVYGNLLRGSKFHIRAFTNVLKVQGATYEPTIISAEQFQEILNKQEETEKEDTESISFTPPAGCFGTGPNS